MRVYFTIKANSNHYYYFADSECTTAKAACVAVKSRVYRQSLGRNAFTPFCKPRKPEKWQVEFMEKAEDWEESEFNMEKKQSY